MDAEPLSFSSQKFAPAHKGRLSKFWQKTKDTATKVGTKWGKPVINIAATVFPVLAPVAVAAQYIK